MQPSNVAQPFSDPAWLFEPKWDGFRAICYYDKGRIRFISRRNNDLTKRFPELQAMEIRAEAAVVDGEIVAIDDKGLPCFDELRKPAARVLYFSTLSIFSHWTVKTCEVCR